MNISPKGLQLIKDSEGLRLTPYRDGAGIWTDGWGNTHGVVPNGPPISLEQAEAELATNAGDAAGAVVSLISVGLSQGQFDALVDFVFNLGAGALQGSTLRRLLNARDYQGAADQFPRWVHDAAGNVEPGLVVRRAREQALFRGDA